MRIPIGMKGKNNVEIEDIQMVENDIIPHFIIIFRPMSKNATVNRNYNNINVFRL